MNEKILGTVIEIKKQWWLKINTKPIRKGTFDGAIFPHIIKVKYTVEGKEYVKRKWIGAHTSPPTIGSTLTVVYSVDKPTHAKIIL